MSSIFHLRNVLDNPDEPIEYHIGYTKEYLDFCLTNRRDIDPHGPTEAFHMSMSIAPAKTHIFLSPQLDNTYDPLDVRKELRPKTRMQRLIQRLPGLGRK